MTHAQAAPVGHDECVGDTSAAQLYADHRAWLVAWLQRRVGCPDTAQDVAQDAFLRLLGRGQSASLQQPRNLLRRVAHGLMVDHFRRRDLERGYLEAVAALPAEQAPSEEQRAEVIEALTRIDALLDGLPDRARRVFLMSRLEGRRHTDIAGALHVSLSTVEKDMAAALRHCYLARRTR